MIFSQLQLKYIKNIIVSFIMIEPLSLKSEPASAQIHSKSNILTASQLLTQFSLKSPSANRICLTDRIHSTNSKITSTPKVQTKSITMFQKVKGSHEEAISLKTKSVKMEAKVPTNQTSKDNYRENIVRVINQNRSKQKKGKNMALPRSGSNWNKQNRCPTERSTPLRSHAVKFDICLDNKASIAPMTSRTANQQKFFRKSSDASTLSLRTKHTASIQHLDDDNDELFNRQSSVQLNLSHKESENVLRTLEFAKKKLYQQIYSLDTKLLNDYHEQKQNQQIKPPKKKQIITISLKRKEEPTNIIYS